MKNIYLLFLIALALFVTPLPGVAGDAEIIFDSPKQNTDRPFFSSLRISPDGKTVWAGTPKTIVRFAGSKRDEFSRENVAAFSDASCYNFKPLAFDSKGSLWMGLSCNKGNPLATFDGSVWRLVTGDILPLPEHVKTVSLMAFDKNNVMWLVTYSGLLRYDGKEWKLFSPENSPIPNRQVTALNIDRKGSVWIGTNGGHIARFDGSQWEVFKAGPSFGLPTYSMAKSIKIDTRGVMYFANYNGEVYKYTGAKFQPIRCSSNDSSCYFEDVALDVQNVLWVANNGVRSAAGRKPNPGLFRYDGKNFKKFDLPNNGSFWLEIDPVGNKWIASSGQFNNNGAIVVFREDGVKAP